MGCCGSKSTYGIEPETIKQVAEGVRTQHGNDVMIMAIKDQNTPGKLCIAGKVEQKLVQEITNMLTADPKNKDVVLQSDKYDHMWDYVWRKTSLTSGHSAFSLAKPYFPRGQLIVKLLDLLAEAGWSLSATPNFGGVESRDDKGQVTSCVDWPVFVFYREQGIYTNKHMLFAIKDSNVPGKVCAAGPVGELEAAMTQALGPVMKDIKSEKDSYDDDYDVVWRNTSITTGHQMMSFAKAYFPKGQNNVKMLETAYAHGWRCVAAPNFGGQGDSWPCYVFRQLANQGNAAPEILFASIKDSNMPGKLCFSGPSAQAATDAVCNALKAVEGNTAVKSEKDEYDNDHDCVVRDVHITTGIAAFSLKLPYFPRCDSMVTWLNAVGQLGFQTSCCPNFGGMLDSWPTFVFEKCDNAPPVVFMAFKDNNIPGKVCVGGDGIAADASLAPDLLGVLRALCGQNVQQTVDDYDKTFALAFKNTVVTTGHATFTMSKPYWPHGYVVEAILQVMYRHGYKVVGGPNFGDNGEQWPGMIFQKISQA